MVVGRFQTTTINRNGMREVTTGYQDPYGNKVARTYDNYGLKSISRTRTDGGMFAGMGEMSYADQFAHKYLGLRGNYFGNRLGLGGLGFGDLGIGSLGGIGGYGGIRDLMDMLQMRRLRNSLGFNSILPMNALGIPEGYEHSFEAGNRWGDYVKSETEQTTAGKIRDYVGIAKDIGLVDYIKDNVFKPKEKEEEKEETWLYKLVDAI